jgi:hypothetical protein
VTTLSIAATVGIVLVSKEVAGQVAPAAIAAISAVALAAIGAVGVVLNRRPRRAARR